MNNKEDPFDRVLSYFEPISKEMSMEPRLEPPPSYWEEREIEEIDEKEISYYLAPLSEGDIQKALNQWERDKERNYSR